MLKILEISYLYVTLLFHELISESLPPKTISCGHIPFSAPATRPITSPKFQIPV
jgi:hypothetical protein